MVITWSPAAAANGGLSWARTKREALRSMRQKRIWFGGHRCARLKAVGRCPVQVGARRPRKFKKLDRLNASRLVGDLRITIANKQPRFEIFTIRRVDFSCRRDVGKAATIKATKPAAMIIGGTNQCGAPQVPNGCLFQLPGGTAELRGCRRGRTVRAQPARALSEKIAYRAPTCGGEVRADILAAVIDLEEDPKDWQRGFGPDERVILASIGHRRCS
jgi:hypothetical protein